LKDAHTTTNERSSFVHVIVTRARDPLWRLVAESRTMLSWADLIHPSKTDGMTLHAITYPLITLMLPKRRYSRASSRVGACT